jgi:hypothetical protein
VLGPIVQLDPQEARRRMTGRPITGRPVTPGPQVRQPAVWDFGDALAASEHSAPRRPAVPPMPAVTPSPVYAAGPAVTTRADEPAGPAVLHHPYETSSHAVVTAPHPYDPDGQMLQPIIGAANPYALPVRGHRHIMSTLSLLIERLLTIVVVLVVCAAIVAIAAAEASPQANQSLSALIHIDIRKHIELMLTWLRQRLQSH